MLDTAIALHSFFSGFGVPAFVENCVPDELYTESVDPVSGKTVGVTTPVDPPYITYELREPEPGERSSLKARVWDIDTDFEFVARKADEIKTAIGRGISLPVPGGAVWLWLDTNFCQFQPTDEPKLKVAYLSLIIGAFKE